MFKANSYNNFITTPSFINEQTTLSRKKPITTIPLLKDHQGNMIRKYQINLQDFNHNLSFFEWRKNIHHPIPKITQIKHQINNNKHNIVSVFCQHISINLQDIPLLKIQQIIYCLSQMLLGYQEIYSKLGFVCIQPKFIGLNTKGQILIWISQNLISNVSENRKISNQKEIVQKVILLLQNKSINKNDYFFVQLRKIEPCFKKVLEFIMLFKNCHKLKIIPKIIFSNVSINTQKMLSSNTFSNSSQNNQPNQMLNSQSFVMKNSGHIMSSQSQSQFLSVSRMNQNQFSLVNRKPQNRTSIMQNNTPKNVTSSIYQKSGPKINFSYSQKREDLSTPKQSGFIRDYTSDRNVGFGSKIFSEYNQIQEFTLEDPKKSQVVVSEKSKKKSKYQRKIVQTYSIYYVPQSDTTYLKTQLDLKKSSTSEFSQSSFSQKRRLGSQDNSYNKTSMTTNHRSAVTQSFQSLGKQSNDEEYYPRKNELFSSNNSHKTTYSIIKNSFIENEPGRNNASFIILGNYDKPHQSALNSPALISHQTQKPEPRKDMYTFGGLIKVTEQPFSVTKNELKKVEKSIFQTITTPLNEQNQQKIDTKQQANNPKTLSNQIHTKSIEQLYNNLYFNSQKKSMIMDESHYQIKLSPVKEENNSGSKVQRSVVIGKNFHLNNESTSHLKTFEQSKQFMSPRIEQSIQFDYNQWRGIKGLLNQSNCHELKQSIHCGPDIRSPVNIKLQLLGKFGRQIAQSIMPSTPSIGHHSRAISIYTTNTDQQSLQFY